MPATPRRNNKATRIAFSILGTPPNMPQRRKRKRKDTSVRDVVTGLIAVE